MITLKTVYKICDWINKYQPNMSAKDWVHLYARLMEEERDEMREAVRKKDIVEYIDWVWDYIWISIGYYYFSDLDFSPCFDLSNVVSQSLVKHWPIEDTKFVNQHYEFIRLYIDEIMQEILKSNFTKKLELQKDWEKAWKVIKGDDYVAPNFEEILKKIL